ncbi:MAG: glycosyltransferase, partial [Spirochaetaceae bacterium]
ETYRPLERNAARDLWSLPHGKNIVLFGALHATADVNKGYDLLVSSLKHVQSSVMLCVFGASHGPLTKTSGRDVRYLGAIRDDVALRALYSAADVTVVPSRIESFGLTALESLACGTPVVGFNATGTMDIVLHKDNGYLAEPYEPVDLAFGIDWVLDNDARRRQLGIAARAQAERQFSYPVVGARYRDLYRLVVQGT